MAEMVTRDGCSLHYQEAGASADAGKETLVLLTGWSQTAAMFDRLVAALGDEYRVISYDHRNHGESGSSDNGARVAALATDLRELLDHLGVEEAHLLGNSMGCSVLWSFIDNYGTSRIRSLVLVDQPSVCALVPWLAEKDAADVGAIMSFTGAADLIEALLGDDAAKVRADFVGSMILDDTAAEDREFIVAENMKLRMPFGARLILDHVMQDWRDLLPRIDVPTLVIGGDESHVDTTSQRYNADHIPGARLHIFSREDGGDHFPFFQGPKAFAGVLTEFLDSVD